MAQNLHKPFRAAAGGCGANLRRAAQRPPAALGVPLLAAHLCAGHRRRRRRAPSPPPRRSTPCSEPEERRRQGRRGAVGKLIAERAKAAGVEHVVFDRGGYIFHGRVKALADAAREGGLDF